MKLNKRKRLIWFKEQLETKEDFANIVFTDECTVQLEHHSHICFRKKLQPCVLKQRAKQLIKVHLWVGISARGAMRVVMSTSIMDDPHLAAIFEVGLLIFY